jgi:hypothetical protein
VKGKSSNQVSSKPNIFDYLSKRFRRRKPSILRWLIWLSLVIILFVLLVPSTQRFEANIAAEEVQFTIAQKDDQVLLHDFDSVKNLSLEGIQTFNLSGKFSSKSLPNQQGSLMVELSDRGSRWMIQAADLKTSSLSLVDLRVSPQTRITRFRLASSKQVEKTEYSLRFDILPKAGKANSLQLDLGDQPLKIIISGRHTIKFGGEKISLPNGQSTEINFIATPQNFKLPVNSETSISIGIPKPDKDNLDRWIAKSLSVEDVSFVRSNNSGASPSDSFEESTILQGQIRIAEKELKIQPHQFITWQPLKPGGKIITGLQAAFPDSSDGGSEKKPNSKNESSEPKGLEVRLSGEARRIEVGLDKEFPVANLQAGILNGRLPNDALTVLISALVAIITSILPWLLSK